MSYAIIRNANYKLNNLAGLYKHNERKNINYSNKDILKEKSINNYSIKKCNTTYNNALKILQKENNLQGRIIKTTNVICELIITSDKEFFEHIGEEETKRYFQTAYNFVAQYKHLGEEYIISAKVHLDESTPHLHLVYVPVVHKKDKNVKEIHKIACSEYWKGKDSYKQLQDNFYKYIKENGFDLERGKTREIEHLSTEKLKQVTNYDNIKYEIENRKIQHLETKNVDLILQQNRELIQNNNKLSTTLNKTLKAITRLKELEKEIQELKQENVHLKMQNNKLQKYINAIFEYVSILFDFPKERLKNIVENFMKNR